jgi:hypothetical protein
MKVFMPSTWMISGRSANKRCGRPSIALFGMMVSSVDRAKNSRCLELASFSERSGQRAGAFPAFVGRKTPTLEQGLAIQEFLNTRPQTQKMEVDLGDGKTVNRCS